jgi:hypothetical protein
MPIIKVKAILMDRAGVDRFIGISVAVKST